MGKSSGGKVQVNEFNMSMHVSLAVDVDAVTEIVIGEMSAWSGEATAQGSIDINRPELFGGVKKEGGVRGNAYFLPGGPDQVLPGAIAARFNLTSATCPAFRARATLFFLGDAVGDTWVPTPGTSGGGGSGGTGGGGGDEGGWIPPGGGGIGSGGSVELEAY